MNLNLGFEAAAASAKSPLAAANLPMADQYGKLDGAGGGGGGGGLAVGIPSARAVRVPIIVLNRWDFDERRCGGRKGTNGKLCIAVECGVAAHSRNKGVAEVFVVGGRPVDEVVCIACGPVPDGEQPDAVYMSPVLALSSLGEEPSAYLESRRPLEQWQYLFESLMANPKASKQEIDELADRIERNPTAGFTPFKKRRVEVESPVDELDFAEFMTPMEPSLPEDPRQMLATIAERWPLVVQNMGLLKEALQNVLKNHQRLREHAEEELNDINDSVGQLRMDIGSRGPEVGTRSVFAILEDKVSEAAGADVPGSLGLSDEAKAELKIKVQGEMKPTVENLYADLTRELAPIAQFVGQWSSNTTGPPGDILAREVNSIRAVVERLESQVASADGSRSASRGPSLSLGLGGAGANQSGGLVLSPNPVSSLPAAPSESLLADIHFLKESLSEIRDEIGAGTVTIDDKTFSSRANLAAFLTEQSVPEGGFAVFIDAMGLLAVSHRQGMNDDMDCLTYQDKMRKSGFDTVEESKVANSFMQAIPAHFGAAPATGALARDSRVLPGVLSFKDWESGNGHIGLMFDITSDIASGKKALQEICQAKLRGEASSVARQMIADSHTFLKSLLTWITKTYNNTQQRTMASPKEAWALTAHCTRTIFNLLNKARACGRVHTKENRLEQTVWGMMKAYEVQEALLQLDFDAYPEVSHALNIHLQDNSVTRSAHSKLNAKVEESEKNIKALLASVESLKKKKGG